jgi:hypothetical protein
VGACLAQARHRLEGAWGLSTLEVPESVVCRSEPFGWFAAHLLAQLPRFRSVYNELLGEYRRENRIRSSAHPMPDLAADGPWLEAPFWLWTPQDPVRRRVFSRLVGDRIELTDRHRTRLTLSLSPDAEAARAVGELAQWERSGAKIRPRALVTTLWARLALGDLFIHGIGGAKYDRVTDGLLERFFGLEPPGFLVVSATKHLPVESPETTEDDARLIRHRLRELEFHPELYAQPSGTDADSDRRLGDLAADKRRWIAADPAEVGPRRRFREIRRINEAIGPWVAGQRKRLSGELDLATRAIQARSILRWREYAFCLYPEKTLREFLLAVLPKGA